MTALPRLFTLAFAFLLPVLRHRRGQRLGPLVNAGRDETMIALCAAGRVAMGAARARSRPVTP